MEELKSSSKTQMQEEWKNEPQNIDNVLVYLKEDISSSEKEVALDEVWNVFADKKTLLKALLKEPECISLLPRLQFLAWKENPQDTENGLDVIRGFLIQGKHQEAEDSLDDLFSAANSPIELLENMSEDSSFDAIKTLCQQKAIQYKALNSLKGKEAFQEYKVTKEGAYYGNKVLSLGKIDNFTEIGKGYGVLEFKLYFRGENTGIDIYPHNDRMNLDSGGVFFVQDKKIVDGQIVQDGEKKFINGEIVQVGESIGNGYSIHRDNYFGSIKVKR